MNRKEFLRRSGMGVCCGAAAVPLWNIASGQESAEELPLSPCDEKVSQGQAVIRRLMDQMDANLDVETRRKIMENCGLACYEGANGRRSSQKPGEEQVKAFLEGMRKYVGEDQVTRDGDEIVVYFKYTANPRGLKVSDGYCLCPILEDAPRDISASYCQCSVGYVRELFERNVGRPVGVELTDSVLRGGKTCSFTVRFRA